MLELARYKIKTALGISEGEYSRMEEHMLHGILQGGKASSFIWLIVSSLIMEIMKEKCEGVSCKDPRSTMESTRAMDGFVDDTTAWANHFKEYSKKREFQECDPKDIAKKLQIEAQLWEELLYGTGGELELSKCFYYIAHWKWKPDGSAYLATPEEMGGNLIKITNSATGKEIEIEHKSCAEAHRTLGVMKIPRGDNQAELQRLKEKADNFSRQLGASKI